jgi:opacity protein-like surface antigen
MNRFKLCQFLKLISIIVISTSITIASSGRLTNVGTTAASFLEVGVGSRAIGMGGAFVGIADDATTLYWNPGGMSRISSAEAVFEHIDWLADISFDFLGAVIPLGPYGSAGIFVKSMSIPRMKVRTIMYQDGTGEEFDASSISFGVSYAQNLTDRFSIGFNLKYISESIWHESTYGFAIDVGTLYYTGIEGLRIGAAITNFGTDMQLDGSDLIIYHDIDPLKLGNNDKIMGKLMTDKWPLPLNMQFGIAYDFFNTRYSRLTASIDAFHPISNTEGINAGIELALYNMIFIRAGYKAIGQVDTEEGLTLGGGLQYKLFGRSFIKFDYAYADFGRLEEVNRFTLRLNF